MCSCGVEVCLSRLVERRDGLLGIPWRTGPWLLPVQVQKSSRRLESLLCYHAKLTCSKLLGVM